MFVTELNELWGKFPTCTYNVPTHSQEQGFGKGKQTLFYSGLIKTKFSTHVL